MSVEMWKKLEKDLCRCCHTRAQTSYRSLYTPFNWLDKEKVVFYEMLQECFNIELAPVLESLSHVMCTICNACVKQLQAAVQFKRQVQKCEQQFQEMYMQFIGKVNAVEVEIKQELVVPEDEFATSLDIQPLSDYDNGNSVLGCPKSADDVKEDQDSYLPDDGRGAEDDNTEYIGFQLHTEENTSQLGKEKKDPIKKINLLRKKKTPGKNTGSKVAKQKSENRKEAKKKKKSGTATPKVKSKRSSFHIDDTEFKKVGDFWQCSSCEKRSKSRWSIITHVKTVHLKIPKFTCPQCPKKFFTLAPFNKHKLDDHNIDERVRCNACEQAFNTKNQLRKHINCFHMLGKKHKCTECDFECFSVEYLYKHKYKHKTVKDHHCKYCKKAFLRKTTLMLHERIHTGDRRKVCSVCGQAFVQKASLNYHMTKYHPEVVF